jgi:putative tryptophan/tyrosine transport system substrate-binding protein
MRRREFITLIGRGVAAWPLAANAQQIPRRRVGVLMSTSDSDPQEAVSVAAFVAALGERGWIQGGNLEVIYRWAEGHPERMVKNAREMVDLAPDVILVKGANVPAACEATTRIPIVFVVLSDLVAQDYVHSFARPGGNVTGFASFEFALVGKRLELLRELSPSIARVMYIRSLRTGTATRSLFERIAKDAGSVGIALTDGPAEDGAGIARAITTFASGSDRGLVVAFDAFTTVHRASIIELAARYRMPAIYPLGQFARDGGLASYGFDQDDQFRQAATYVDRVLRGEKPGDLPIQAPTKFLLLINLGAAKSLNIGIPQSILARADEMIE